VGLGISRAETSMELELDVYSGSLEKGKIFSLKTTSRYMKTFIAFVKLTVTYEHTLLGSEI
jgi:hypothetical protein